MKQSIFLWMIFLFPLICNAQGVNKSIWEKVLVNDSLYQLESDSYNFDQLSGNIVRNVLNHQIEDINEFVHVDDDTLRFRISFDCGCGSNEKRLVTNGKLLQDQEGRSYYPIKFLFSNYNKGCKALCHERLSFDISALKKDSTELYLKLNGFEQLIPYEY